MPRRARYQHIAEDLRAKIARHTYPVGESLPSLTSLASEYEASATVVQRALTELKHEGLIQGQPGKGVFVLREPSPDQPSDDYAEIMRHVDALRQKMTEAFDDLDRRVTELETRAHRPGQRKDT